jgi:acyl-homoserine lactone acylase PvdQ
MSTHDHDRSTQTEAAAAASPMSAADRVRFWAGLNRFLESETDPPRPWTPNLEPVRVLRRPPYDHE